MSLPDFWLPSTVSPGLPDISSFSIGGRRDPPPLPPPLFPRAGRQIAYMESGPGGEIDLHEVKRTMFGKSQLMVQKSGKLTS